jgi:hypothetical protein
MYSYLILVGGLPLKGSMLHYWAKPNIRYYSSDTNNSNQNLDCYLAGLIEGVGHFNVPNVLKGPSGKSRVAGIEVIFALKDKQSAELFKTIFGGNLYLRPNRNLVR